MLESPEIPIVSRSLEELEPLQFPRSPTPPPPLTFVPSKKHLAREEALKRLSALEEGLAEYTGKTYPSVATMEQLKRSYEKIKRSKEIGRLSESLGHLRPRPPKRVFKRPPRTVVQEFPTIELVEELPPLVETTPKPLPKPPKKSQVIQPTLIGKPKFSIMTGVKRPVPPPTLVLTEKQERDINRLQELLMKEERQLGHLSTSERLLLNSLLQDYPEFK